LKYWRNFMSNIVPYNDIEKMATAISKSGLFGVKKPDEAIALMLVAQAEGLHPATAARDYHVIQGRPALKADAMLARFQQAGGSVQWKVYTDEQVTGIFTHPAGGTLEVSWTLAQAKSIGIANKDNWRNYPRAMLRARCVSEGIRSVYPGCVVGVYTPEEVEDFKPETRHMGNVVEVSPDAGPEMVALDEVVLKAFPLYIPGNQSAYSSYDTTDEWLKDFDLLTSRIAKSEKLSAEQKSEKMKALRDANNDTVEKFNSFDKVKVRTAMAKLGENAPKPEVSQENL
jgi:hypothetical protein